MKKMKMIIIVLVVALISISTAYAVTIIKASDVIYDTSKSNGSSSNVQGAIDELYSMAEKGGVGSNNIKLINENIITYITDLAKTDTTNLAYDDTADKNLRYIGANPNNYVEFNGELWRIIGVMNNVKDADGKNASRVKLIRAETIGDYYWSGSTANDSNDWAKSSLNTGILNGTYYNSLTNDSKTMISNVMWNIGGRTDYSVNASNFYISERGAEVYSGHATKSTGKVGLIYPSDFGYAVEKSKRDLCLSNAVGNYGSNGCNTHNWLFYSKNQWTITPRSSNSFYAFYIYMNGYVSLSYVNDASYAVRPVVYLDTKLLITKGIGTEENPYKISFEKENSNDASNASPPKIDDNGKLIPVKLADDGKVTMVSKNDDNWYNYSEKRWANAVILNDSPSQTYKVGDTIKEADIESYFVWIPKYKYKLWNTGTANKNAHEIDIIFDTKDTTDIEGKSCKTPMTSGATGNCNNGEYMTHPAFISLGVNGFWVGKFETGYKGATSTAAAQVNSSDSSKIIIKPNAYSWRGNSVYNMFLSSYNYNRALDSHMMKSTEWGAVAIFSHSKYGINREVNINNNSSYKTGYSALPSTNQHTYPGTSGDGNTFNQSYNTPIGYLASTTGNISGVYDMSGGAFEYMSSYISGSIGSSGFTTTTLSNYDAKYFDVYNASSTINTFQYRILGDATGEMGAFIEYVDGDNVSRWHNSWYSDYSGFVVASVPWVHRGGFYHNGVLASQFYFDRRTGGADTYVSSRIVLTA